MAAQADAAGRHAFLVDKASTGVKNTGTHIRIPPGGLSCPYLNVLQICLGWWATVMDLDFWAS